MKKLTTRQIALNGVAAGLYAAITILTASFAYGNIQFRIADALCVLVVLEPSLTVGLTLGARVRLRRHERAHRLPRSHPQGSHRRLP